MVEWKKLGEVCCIRTGKLNANAQVENGKYPFFTCDINPYKIDTYAFDGEAILISGNGNLTCGKEPTETSTDVVFRFLPSQKASTLIFSLRLNV